jgi:hypothetical protein
MGNGNCESPAPQFMATNRSINEGHPEGHQNLDQPFELG